MISRSHPIARRLKALRTDRDLRDREGVLVGEGVHLAVEALRARAPIEFAVVSPRLLAGTEGRTVAGRLTAAGVPLYEAADGTLESLSDARSPQGLLVLVRRARRALEEIVGATRPLAVLACGIQDPGNLGAIVRVADASGASGVVTSPGSADPFHPRAVRASAGAIFRLPVLEAGVTETLAAVEGAGLVLAGADPHGGTRYDAFDWGAPTALVLGSEGGGIPGEIEARLAARVLIPMRKPAESLSVAAAAAVLLFEAARRRSTLAG